MPDTDVARLRDVIGMAWTGTPYGPGNENSVDAVMDAVPDGWAKLDGEWVQIKQVGLLRGHVVYAARPRAEQTVGEVNDEHS